MHAVVSVFITIAAKEGRAVGSFIEKVLVTALGCWRQRAKKKK